MGQEDRLNEKDKKAPVETRSGYLLQEIPEIIAQNLQDVRDDIQKTNSSLQLMLAGIHKEIEEIKKLTRQSHDIFRQVAGSKVLRKHIETEDPVDSLDFLEVPPHLRRTFETIMLLKRATAKEVADRTGKSRPLESDYLNQLADRKFVVKKKEGKHVKFIFIRATEVEDEDEENNTNYNATEEFIRMRKMEVTNASNSSER
ncbi:MAG: hypothetical protein JSV04_03290 [Candidatus Heimdallarchaeota archaeon]|nr:MAG: hypothetical protein JSV04_03290 [Candidatus Heimdallarchaeota archaeon]